MPSRVLDLVKGVCGPGYERNPYTKRCNRKCPRSHERIRTNKRFQCYKKCKPGMLRNKHTQRCKGKGKGKGKASFVKSRSKTRSRSRSRSLSRFYRF